MKPLFLSLEHYRLNIEKVEMSRDSLIDRTSAVDDKCVYIASCFSRLKRRHIDHKPVFHVAFQHAFIRFIDILNLDHFDI